VNSISIMDEVGAVACVSQTEITLAHYQRMCVAIAEAGAVDEVKDIRDRALALEEYSKQAKNTELEAVVVRIRIRAERRAGELLRDMEKAKGAAEFGWKRGNGALPRLTEQDVTDDVAAEQAEPVQPTSTPTLAQLGISKQQSSRWQKLLLHLHPPPAASA